MPPQFDAHGFSSQKIAREHIQDYKCSLNRSDSAQRISGTPIYTSMPLPSTGMNDKCQDFNLLALNQRQELRQKIDTMLYCTYRSHKNAVSMAKNIKELIDSWRQTRQGAEQRHSPTKISESSQSRMRVEYNQSKSVESIRSNQKLSHNKQPIHYDQDQALDNNTDSFKLELQRSKISKDQEKASINTLEQKQCSTGVKCLEKLKPFVPLIKLNEKSSIYQQVSCNSQEQIYQYQQNIDQDQKTSMIRDSGNIEVCKVREINQLPTVNDNKNENNSVQITSSNQDEQIKRKRGRPPKNLNPLTRESQTSLKSILPANNDKKEEDNQNKSSDQIQNQVKKSQKPRKNRTDVFKNAKKDVSQTNEPPKQLTAGDDQKIEKIGQIFQINTVSGVQCLNEENTRTQTDKQDSEEKAQFSKEPIKTCIDESDLDQALANESIDDPSIIEQKQIQEKNLKSIVSKRPELKNKEKLIKKGITSVRNKQDKRMNQQQNTKHQTQLSDDVVQFQSVENQDNADDDIVNILQQKGINIRTNQKYYLKGQQSDNNQGHILSIQEKRQVENINEKLPNHENQNGCSTIHFHLEPLKKKLKLSNDIGQLKNYDLHSMVIKEGRLNNQQIHQQMKNEQSLLITHQTSDLIKQVLAKRQ